MAEEYVGSRQEYIDQMNEEWWSPSACVGCGRPADVDCHELCPGDVEKGAA